MKKWDYLKKLVFQGAKYKNLELSDKVLDRLNYELSVIETKGFSDYFILYSRIIDICNELKLIRSFGRGSAPSSLVNYCLDITHINPLEENLRFENFISPLQVRLPDIDIDIPVGSKKLIFERLNMKYPEYHNYAIAYLPDSTSLSKEDVYYRDKVYKKHYCGTLITNEKLTDSVFTYQYEKFYLSENYQKDKMMDYKFDLLELTILHNYQSIVSVVGEKYHPIELPLNDVLTFETLIKGDRNGIYGFNFSYLTEIFERYQPNSIYDLSLIYAVNRPPLMEIFPQLIENKINKEITYCWTDKRVQTILSETYGVLVYRETFIDLLIEVAGMSFAEADQWRRTFYNKNSKENDALFIMNFSNKCSENSILTEFEIAKLSALILDTAKWMFQKSHSISHALIGYWGAYYKTYFPLEFKQAIKY